MFAKPKESYSFIILCILCVVFVCIKIPNLNIPFFWDEAWVYTPALKTMAHDGLSMLPSGLVDSYSRGHPLLFFFCGALWVKIFGGSFFTLHAFALVIAIGFIFTLYFIVRKLFSSTLALIVSVITLAQPIFFAQAGLVLPEIFLSLWAILTIYHFVKKQWFYYFLFGSLMLLTKESGVIVIASLMLYQAICFSTQKITFQSLKTFVKDSFIAFAPMLSFIAFLIIQHHQRGYYFYPDHIALLNFNWHDFQETLKHLYDYLFEKQGRIYITVSFLALFALFYKPIPIIFRLLIVIGLFTCMKIFFRYWALPDWLMISFIGLFTTALYYFMHIKYAPKAEGTNKILAVIFIIGVLYMVFSSINFFTNRYLFMLVPLMVLYFSFYIKESLQFRVYLPYAWSAIIASLLVYTSIVYGKTSDLGDDSPKYIQSVKMEKMMVNYLEEQKLEQANIYCKFTMAVALKDKNIGFRSDTATFMNVKEVFNKNTEYVIYTTVDCDTLWDKDSDTLPHFQIVKKIDYGTAHGKLFKRILQDKSAGN